MNPTKNKKDLETTIDDIRNFAYSYLEKYNPSTQQLKTYLFKKLIKTNCKRVIYSVNSNLAKDKGLEIQWFSIL